MNSQGCADQLAASVSINVDVSAAMTATVDTNGDGKTTTADAKCSYGPAPKRGGILLFGAIARPPWPWPVVTEQRWPRGVTN